MDKRRNDAVRQTKYTYVFESAERENKPVSSTVVLQPVTSWKELQIFYRVPWAVYTDDPYWVPSFWKDLVEFLKCANPFWQHAEIQLYTAYLNSKPVGRIAAIIDHSYTETTATKIGYFGFFECINNAQIAQSLLEAAETWLKYKEVTELRGPINGHIDFGCGFLVEGFNKLPYLNSVYTPPYYLQFMEQYGMQPLTDLISYEIDLTKPIPSKVQETAKKCADKGIHVRSFNRRQMKREMQQWFTLFDQIFSDHWGYAPVTYREMMRRFNMKYLRWIINPRLFLYAEVNQQPIGFRLSLPNYNPLFKEFNGRLGIREVLKFFTKKQMLHQGKFIVMGLKKEYQGKGIGTCLNYHTLIAMKQLGYTSAEYGWIEENNIASRKAGEKIGGKPHKKHRIFSKKI
jgi:hypothetical protein